ncbi:hypothetical protein K9L97_02750 [Candidatus Woesearchaeota archaeon]|nr:hypothetical protein [Candidatus Woesearchaeota archaeon]
MKKFMNLFMVFIVVVTLLSSTVFAQELVSTSSEEKIEIGLGDTMTVGDLMIEFTDVELSECPIGIVCDSNFIVVVKMGIVDFDGSFDPNVYYLKVSDNYDYAQTIGTYVVVADEYVPENEIATLVISRSEERLPPEYDVGGTDTNPGSITEIPIPNQDPTFEDWLSFKKDSWYLVGDVLLFRLDDYYVDADGKMNAWISLSSAEDYEDGDSIIFRRFRVQEDSSLGFNDFKIFVKNSVGRDLPLFSLKYSGEFFEDVNTYVGNYAVVYEDYQKVFYKGKNFEGFDYVSFEPQVFLEEIRCVQRSAVSEKKCMDPYARFKVKFLKYVSASENEVVDSKIVTVKVGETIDLFKGHKFTLLGFEDSKESSSLTKAKIRLYESDSDSSDEEIVPLNGNKAQFGAYSRVEEGAYVYFEDGLKLQYDGVSDYTSDEEPSVAYFKFHVYNSGNDATLNLKKYGKQQFVLGDSYYYIYLKAVNPDFVTISVSKDGKSLEESIPIEVSDSDENFVYVCQPGCVEVEDGCLCPKIKIRKTINGFVVSGSEDDFSVDEIRIMPGSKSMITLNDKKESKRIPLSEDVEIPVKFKDVEKQVKISTDSKKLETILDVEGYAVKTRNAVVTDNEGISLETDSGKKLVKVLPSVASEKAKEVLGAKYSDLELKEVGNEVKYVSKSEKKYNVLGFIPITGKSEVSVDIDTGSVSSKKPWFSVISTN